MGGQTDSDAVVVKHLEPCERTLIYVPIVHTQADMGTLNESIQRLKVRRLGGRGWERNLNFVDELWAQIEKIAEDLNLPWNRVRVYQDGLPVCGREVKIVTELAQAGSRNHRLLLHLRGKGATLMGTESSALLVEEYQIAKQAFAPGKPEASGGGEAQRNALRISLLRRRDQYIGRRINETLMVGETGLLFLGVLHSLAEWLDKGIHVVYPLHRPLGQGKSHAAR